MNTILQSGYDKYSVIYRFRSRPFRPSLQSKYLNAYKYLKPLCIFKILLLKYYNNKLITSDNYLIVKRKKLLSFFKF